MRDAWYDNSRIVVLLVFGIVVSVATGGNLKFGYVVLSCRGVLHFMLLSVVRPPTDMVG